MACCVLGALIISHILAIWHDRRRIALYAAGLFVCVGLLGWQINAHAQHIQQFLSDAKTVLLGEDPAVVALNQRGADCPRKPADTSLSSAIARIEPR